MIDLPYFDLLLEARRRNDPAGRAFERFVHWGYWPEPEKARRDEADFVAAMERLDNELLAAAGLQNGQNVLDVGCGFGGTLDAINKRHQTMNLVGVNIDPRQLEIAGRQVKAGYDNQIRFVEADACALPFPAKTFHRVLAVECVFHFPSRARFLKEASRVLRPGGRLVLSDFVPAMTGGGGFGWLEREIAKGYGSQSAGWEEGSYKVMARAAGLEIEADRDVTANTLPTYAFLLDLLRESGAEQARRMKWPTRWISWLSRLGLVRYRILSFRKPEN